MWTGDRWGFMSQGANEVGQAQRPHGTTGRIFGWAMASLNAKAYRWTLEQLRGAPPKSFLEIGFGTGHLLEQVARTFRPARIAGVDPSELMLEQAARRLHRFRKRIEIDLRLGDDRALPEATFDAIAALHSFQFWAEPHATLREIRARLVPGGRFLLVLRKHGWGARRNLPNPLSRDKDEVTAAIDACAAAGLNVHGLHPITRSSQGIVLS